MPEKPRELRRVSFFREGQSLDTPAGWVIYNDRGEQVCVEWNPDRPRTELEQELEKLVENG